ncbi:MAG: hypothetical protein Q8N30_11125 [Methylococcales bacterium]|nr:hypothetical protein [Methylococcales bacterium]
MRIYPHSANKFAPTLLFSRSNAPALECSRDAPRLAPQRGAKAFPRGASLPLS